ncbi:hypothetical protein THAOC_01546, partial [Thalassiosira oceanica]
DSTTPANVSYRWPSHCQDVAGFKIRLPSVELGRWSLWLSYVGDEGGVVSAGVVGLVLVDVGPAAGLCLAAVRGLEPSSKNPLGTPVNQGTARPVAISYRADVLLSRNWEPPSEA